MMVAVAALGVFFSGPGQTYSNSTFIDQFINDFGWSRTQISGVYSIATFCAGMIMIVVGRFIDRFGQRIMMVTIGVLFACALFFNSTVNSIGMLAVGFFLIRLLGQGSMTLIPNTLVAQWFIKKRGVAFSLMSLGTFISSALFPVVNTWLIGTWSWQFAWRFWGVALLIIFVPVAWFFVRNKPEDIGLEPDGKIKNITNKIDFASVTVDPIEADWTLKEAMRTRAFWLILVCIGIPSMINTGITFHIFSIFNSNGLSAEMAATILSMMALVGIPMSFVSGYVLDKIPSHYALVGIFIIEIFLLILLTMLVSSVLAFVFGLFWGVANGLERIGLKAIWPNFFGRRYIGSINGVAAMMMVIGSSLGPLPFGSGFDLFGSYHPVLLTMLVFPLIGLFSALFVKKPSKLINT
nr:MFS transporter [Amphibacillus cookii]